MFQKMILVTIAVAAMTSIGFAQSSESQVQGPQQQTPCSAIGSDGTSASYLKVMLDQVTTSGIGATEYSGTIESVQITVGQMGADAYLNLTDLPNKIVFASAFKKSTTYRMPSGYTITVMCSGF